MEVLTLFTFNVIKVLLLSSLSAFFGFLFAPFLINFLEKIRFWKKEARRKTITGEEAKVVYSFHKDKEVNIPRGGGIMIWASMAVFAFLFYLLSFLDYPWWIKKFNFISRGQTWLPLFTLISGSLIGLLDDALVVSGKGKYIAGGLTFKKRFIIISLLGLVGGLWFYYKLGWDSIHIPVLFNFPFGIDWTLGIWIIPVFILVMVASWSGGVIDGLDGLAATAFASIFGAFLIIAFSQGKTELAVFCGIILGSLFAFLWFNIPPARFYMGETGILGLTSTMTVIAFLTDSVVVLPIIAGPLVIEAGSIILQLLSKKIRGKKLWFATPIHHHFEAKGWPHYQITMRFWIISIICAILGVAIRLLG